MFIYAISITILDHHILELVGLILKIIRLSLPDCNVNISSLDYGSFYLFIITIIYDYFQA